MKLLFMLCFLILIIHSFENEKMEISCDNTWVIMGFYYGIENVIAVAEIGKENIVLFS